MMNIIPMEPCTLQPTVELSQRLPRSGQAHHLRVLDQVLVGMCAQQQGNRPRNLADIKGECLEARRSSNNFAMNSIHSIVHDLAAAQPSQVLYVAAPQQRESSSGKARLR